MSVTLKKRKATTTKISEEQQTRRLEAKSDLKQAETGQVWASLIGKIVFPKKDPDVQEMIQILEAKGYVVMKPVDIVTPKKKIEG